jgi:hypothetical protein
MIPTNEQRLDPLDYDVGRCHTMAAKRVTAFRIDEELLNEMREVWERDGVAMPEQVRRALRDWLDRRRQPVRADRTLAVTRKRS